MRSLDEDVTAYVCTPPTSPSPLSLLCNQDETVLDEADDRHVDTISDHDDWNDDLVGFANDSHDNQTEVDQSTFVASTKMFRQQLQDRKHTDATSDTRTAKGSRVNQDPVLLSDKRPRDDDDIDVDSAQPPKSPKSSRGRHVSHRPELSQTARQGQAHWLTSRDELRRLWEEREFGEWAGRFREQLKMCSRGHIRSQHECLLRSLQMAVVDGLIRPTALDGEGDAERSFLGWTGFEVVQEHAGEFRRRIAELFERPPTDSTLNNCLRRAGFGPSVLCWGHAWSGFVAFEYDSKRRARHSKGF